MVSAPPVRPPFSANGSEDPAERRRVDAVVFITGAIARAADAITTAQAVRTLDLTPDQALVWWSSLATAHGRAEPTIAPAQDYESYIDHVAGGERGPLRDRLLADWGEEQRFVPRAPYPTSDELISAHA